MEKNGGPDGIRTRDLLGVSEMFITPLNSEET